jgi:hypothetical protein
MLRSNTNGRKAIFLVGLVFLISSSNNFFSLNNFHDKNGLISLNDNNNSSWSRIPLNNKRIFNPNLHVLNDSIILSGYYYDDAHHDYDIIVIKYHINGTKLWEFRFEDDLIGTLEGSVVDQDNNIDLFIMVAPYSYQLRRGKLLVVKVNQDGELLFSKYIHELPDCGIDSVSLDSNNSIYITVEDYQNHTTSLVKLDSYGSFLFSISFDDSEFCQVFTDNFSNVFISPNAIFYEEPLYKFNKNGTLIWKKETADKELYLYLKSDNLGNAFVIYRKYYSINSSITLYLVKFDSSGEILNETKIICGEDSDLSYRLYSIKYYCSNTSTYLFFDDEKCMLMYDNKCELKWNKSVEGYMNSNIFSWYRIISDSNENVYTVYNSNENLIQKEVDIAILRINNNGDFDSQIYWGGNHDEADFEVGFDSQNNLYLLVKSEYVNFWKEHIDISVLVKNPLNGGFPPPIEKIDSGFIFVFTILGVTSTISIIICIRIIRKRPKRFKAIEK